MHLSNVPTYHFPELIVPLEWWYSQKGTRALPATPSNASQLMHSFANRSWTYRTENTSKPVEWICLRFCCPFVCRISISCSSNVPVPKAENLSFIHGSIPGSQAPWLARSSALHCMVVSHFLLRSALYHCRRHPPNDVMGQVSDLFPLATLYSPSASG